MIAQLPGRPDLRTVIIHAQMTKKINSIRVLETIKDGRTIYRRT